MLTLFGFRVINFSPYSNKLKKFIDAILNMKPFCTYFVRFLERVENNVSYTQYKNIVLFKNFTNNIATTVHRLVQHNAATLLLKFRLDFL